MNLCFVYMTAGSAVEAAEIGRELVACRLAACVNVLDGMRSFYWWQGRMEEGREAVLIAKTPEDRVKALIEKARALHSYDCPCIVSLPIADGHQPFLDWIRAETATNRKPSAPEA